MSAVLDALRRNAVERTSDIALIGSDSALSYGVLAERVLEVASSLLAGRTRRCGMLLDNGVGWVVCDLAARWARTPMVPIPTYFSPEQIAHVIEAAGIDTLITDRTPSGMEAVSRQNVTALIGQSAACLRLSPRRSTTLPGRTGKVTFTSGTTGLAKGICLSEGATDRVAHSLLDASRGGPEDRHLCLLPLATLLENIAGVDVPILAGAATAVPSLSEVGLGGSSQLDPQTMLAAIEKYAPTTIVTVPQTLAGLLFAVARSGRRPERLRLIAVGGAPIAASVLDQAEALGLPVYQGYGLSELGSVVAFNKPGANRRGSVGRTLGHVDLRFAPDGEILARGAVFEGYVGSGEAPKTIDGYWPTGDIGHLDPDGYLFLDGRKKNMFITAFGRNVAPEWVECALSASPAIAQAAVFGEARPWNAAVLVPRNGATAAALEHDIRRVNDSLPDYARVARWIVAEEAFAPSNGMATANGRLKRDAVFARYRAQLHRLYDEEAMTHVS
jgi:long-subunit acyl-CoA synthetase (AMP-forming)